MSSLYDLRLPPSTDDIPLPELEAETKWCGVFEIRRPALCPLGIPVCDLLD